MPHPLVYVAADATALFEAFEPRLQRLRAEGFDVCVAAPVSAGLDAFEASGFRTRPLPGQRAWNVAAWIGAYLILQADFIENRPTLVHSFGSPWAWIGSFAAHRAEVPTVIASIDSHDLSSPPHRIGQLLARMPDAVLERAPDATSAYRSLARWLDAYFVYHEEDMRALIDNQVVPAAKLKLILGGTGVDLERFADSDEDLPPQDEARIQLGVSESTRTLIAFATPRPGDASNFRALQRRMARSHPGVGWLEVGPDGDHPDLSPTILRAADIWLHLDASDGDGTALMRAAAMATPVVAIEGPAARSIIVNFETGRVGSADQLPDILVETIGDPKRLRDMGVRARARAGERFDRRDIDEQVLRLYDGLLSRSLTR